jgi:hypothetical protein
MYLMICVGHTYEFISSLYATFFRLAPESNSHKRRAVRHSQPHHLALPCPYDRNTQMTVYIQTKINIKASGARLPLLALGAPLTII